MNVIEEGIRVRYRDYPTSLDGGQYLEKIIQIPFSLPPIAPESVEEYVHQVTGAALPDPRCEAVFCTGLAPNPRRIKRTLNIFLLLWRLAQNRDDLRDAIKPVRLSKIVIIQQYHPRLFDLIAEGPYYLVDLERRFREQVEREGERGKGGEGEARGEVAPALSRSGGPGAGDEGGETISAGPLSEFLGRGLLRALLTCTGPDEADANFADIGPAGVREYVYLTRSSVAEPAAPEDTDKARHPFEPQMVTIPGSKFLMGTPERELDAIARLGADRNWTKNEVPQHEVHLEAYAIGRYPVTNAEFARFIEDTGYNTRDYWTDAGWAQKEKERWTQPRYWSDEKWNEPAQPVVGVSWYEALAYCRWLAQKTGRPYRLPTEAEWEKAARGTDGRRYPWGGEWDPKRCNNKESGPGRTTPVGHFSPQGDSPYGAGEMAGQVWEWCQSRYGGVEARPRSRPRFGYPYRPDDGREEPEADDTRILRGGSWYSDDPAAVCRCGSRFRLVPWHRDNNWGFRCARAFSSAP